MVDRDYITFHHQFVIVVVAGKIIMLLFLEVHDRVKMDSIRFSVKMLEINHNSLYCKWIAQFTCKIRCSP